MDKLTFTLNWKKDGKENEKQIVRKDFFELMDQIRKTFSQNNTYAKKFVELIPKTESMTINVDRNEDLDIPHIIIKLEDNNDIQMIEIPRVNKIIWGILNEYCK